MKKNDIFKHINDEDAARIAAEYPTGDKKQRDRLFRKVESRVSSGFTAGDEVRGVDAYRPRIAMKIASAAAAVAVVAGAGGVGYQLLSSVSRPTESSIVSDMVQAQTEEGSAAEAATASGAITKEELLEKIHSRNYEAYDRINMKYRETMNGVSFMDGVIKRDGLTGNESEMKTWTHTPEYFRDMDEEALARDNTTPEKLAESSTHNEMFFVKDMFICVYDDSDSESQALYEIADRSTWLLDQPTAFSDTYSECLIRDRIDHFDIQEINENTTFLGRDCTDVFMTYVSGEKTVSDAAGGSPIFPRMAPEEGSETTFDKYSDQELYLTVDNETGIILKAKLIIDEEYYEEFEVNELLFDDDAELPENGEYIRNRIAGCAPVSDPSSYDLSIID